MFQEFLFVAKISSCDDMKVCLSIPLMTDIWAVSSLRPLWTFLYMLSCGHMISFLLGKCLRVELLGHRIDIRNCWTFSQSSCTILLPQICMRVPVASYPRRHLMLSAFCNFSHSVGCALVAYCSFNLRFIGD